MVIVRIPKAGLSASSLARFVARAVRAVKLKGTVSVLITDNREMRSLNRRFRGKDRPTDVLSFPPMRDFAQDEAGDLAISAQIAAENAKHLGHSLCDEVKILILHGILHLAGHDHEIDDGQMERKERRLRKSLALPVGLIERTDSRESIRKQRARQ